MSYLVSVEALAGGVLLEPRPTWLVGYPTPQTPLVPATGAEAFIYFRDTTVEADVLPNPDGSGTPLAQPLTPDAFGRLPGYVAQPVLLDMVYSSTTVTERRVAVGYTADSITLGETHVVASQAAMLSISGAHEGSVAIRTDMSGATWICGAGTPTVLSSWTQISTGATPPLNAVPPPVASVDLSNQRMVNAADASADQDLINRRVGDGRFVRAEKDLTTFIAARFGMVGDGTSSNATAITALMTAVSAAAHSTNGVKIILPEGDIKIHDWQIIMGSGQPIGAGHFAHLVLEGQGNTRLVPDASAMTPTILTIDGGGGGRKVTVRDVAWGYRNGDAVVDNDNANPLVVIQNCTYLHTDVHAYQDGMGTLLRLDNVWNSQDNGSYIHGGSGGGVGVEWRNWSGTGGLFGGGVNQTDCYKWSGTQIQGTCPMLFQSAAGGMSNLDLAGVKCTSGLGSAVPFAEVDLGSTAASGDTTLNIVAGQLAALVGAYKFAAGDPILISNPGNTKAGNAGFEANRVQSVAGDVITLVKPVQYQHTITAGNGAYGGKAKIIRGGVGVSIGDNYQLVDIHDGHMEGFGLALQTSTVRDVTINQMESSCDRFHRAINATSGVDIGVVMTLGRSIGGVQSNVLVDIPSWNPAIGAGLNGWFLRGPFDSTGAPGGAVTINDGAQGNRGWQAASIQGGGSPGAFAQMATDQWVQLVITNGGMTSPASTVTSSPQVPVTTDPLCVRLTSDRRRLAFKGTVQNTSGGALNAVQNVATLPAAMWPAGPRIVHVHYSSGTSNTVTVNTLGAVQARGNLAINQWFSMEGKSAPVW